jgi:hypothetical protein
MYRISSHTTPCAICGQPSTALCKRCGRPLCAGCSPPRQRRCYRCEKEFASRKQSRWIAIIETCVLVPILAFVIAAGYQLTRFLETNYAGANKSSIGLLLLIVPLLGLPALWLWVRTRMQRTRFLRERIASQQPARSSGDVSAGSGGACEPLPPR